MAQRKRARIECTQRPQQSIGRRIGDDEMDDGSDSDSGAESDIEMIEGETVEDSDIEEIEVRRGSARSAIEISDDEDSE